MKSSLSLKLTTLAALTLSAFAPLKPATAITFGEVAVEQENLIAVAVPYNYRKYRLAIIEQIPGQQACWSESGSNPVTVDLLLLNFDHTNSCLKAVDTNGYSLRVNGKDDKVEYTLNLVENNGELQLVADHQDPKRRDLVVGRTNGLKEAPLKINLDPQWQFTKRLYEGKAIQHIYLSNNSDPEVIEDVATAPTTNDPADTSTSSTAPTNTNPSDVPVATESTPQQSAPADSITTLVNSLLKPLSQAVYDTYNSLFTSTSSGQSQYAPTPNIQQTAPDNQ
ncbi:MAG: hypothetical protein Tsb0014_47900 [Pleurocapsa sp.]